MVARKQKKQAHRGAVVTEFKSLVLSHFDRDREAWRERELGYLQGGRKAREKQQKLPKANPVTQPAAGKTTKVNAKSTHKDIDFNSLQDFSPSMFTLGYKGFPKCNWIGKPSDLSEDPNSYLLHPEELSLAAVLHMDCATYLTSKRRIFIACIECLEDGLPFRKTNSQQACRIDVNKASRLWEAFNNAGWFQEWHFFRVVGGAYRLGERNFSENSRER
ncbi:hypothetical protein V490_09463 [Pseudogymnoascus sp. VKM F-3557]|nr:hypothetical protein V490_09463 [Pseudogymnoascus sp. VKM F-3557]